MRKMRLTPTILALTIAINLWAQNPSVRPGTGVVRAAMSINGSPESIGEAPGPAPILSISGQVRNASGRLAREAIVSLIPRDRDTGLLGNSQQTVQSDAQGNFAIRGVPPGSYVLVATLTQDSTDYWAEQRIEVVDSSISGLQLQLQGPIDLPGKVTASGGGDLKLQGISLRVSPEDGNSSDASADVATDGTFNLTGLRRTTYRIQLAGLPDGWYLQSAALGNQNVLNEGLRLAEAQEKPALNITISPGAGKVQGVVLNPEFKDAVPRAVVKMFPDPANPHRADLFRTASTDRDGRFVFRNVVPGKYRVLAIRGRSSSAESYDDYLTAMAAGLHVNLGERQTKDIELDLFEAHR